MNSDDSNMGTADLDPTNPVVLAMAIKQMQDTLKELVVEVRELSKRPVCQKPGLCVSLETEVAELHELSKEWQKIAYEREKRLTKAEETVETQKDQIKDLNKRLKPFEDAAQQAKGGKKLLVLLWTIATSGVITWIFLIWQVVQKAQGH